jgi:hypothetical protein
MDDLVDSSGAVGDMHESMTDDDEEEEEEAGTLSLPLLPLDARHRVTFDESKAVQIRCIIVASKNTNEG